MMPAADVADRIAQAVMNLDAWLETMRQPGGYGGPVAHWWQNRFQYTGPGLDWRYEGILTGYARLHEKTGDAKWCKRVNVAARDLLDGQLSDGRYRASRFEMNPDTLGTPHEAAATLGLLASLPHLANRDEALAAARRNLDNLIAKLWDGKGFNDRPGVPGRVPNKLATLAQALMRVSRETGDDVYLGYARAALDDILRYQTLRGHYVGAVHQYGPRGRNGDSRFFPFYNARCIPPLVEGAATLGEQRYLEAARMILVFIDAQMDDKGSWPQVLYAGGARAEWPRWCAGAADILAAYCALQEQVPQAAFERLMACQRPSGAFSTATGFGLRRALEHPVGLAELRDAVPVVGWNDKVLSLLTGLLPDGSALLTPAVREDEQRVTLSDKNMTYRESPREITVAGRMGLAYRWVKTEPWARVAVDGSNLR